MDPAGDAHLVAGACPLASRPMVPAPSLTTQGADMSASISRPVPQPHSLRPRWLVRADRAAYAALMARRRPAAVAAARAVSGVAEPRVVYPALAAAGGGR